MNCKMNIQGWVLLHGIFNVMENLGKCRGKDEYKQKGTLTND